jgi:hypothetical protein
VQPTRAVVVDFLTPLASGAYIQTWDRPTRRLKQIFLFTVPTLLKGFIMKKAINIGASCILVLLVSGFAHGQKRSTKSAASKQAAAAPRIICKGQTVPKGFVVVGYKASAKCGGDSELVIKKPADTETVCDGSPIPEGYHVISQEGATVCMTADSNPLANALSIARDGLIPSPQMPTRSMASAATIYRTQPRRTNSSSEQSSNSDTESQPQSPHPSREEIEIAVRRATVVIGMEMQDVSRAWGSPRTNDKLIEEDGLTNIWGYKMGNVYFRNGIVSKIELLKGY